jgi:hypothetical protein
MSAAAVKIRCPMSQAPGSEPRHAAVPVTVCHEAAVAVKHRWLLRLRPLDPAPGSIAVKPYDGQKAAQ